MQRTSELQEVSTSMSSFQELRDSIAELEASIMLMKEEIKTYRNEIYELQIQLQPKEADVYIPTYPERQTNTKLRWRLYDETYRVAIVTKYGILQVKSVTNGAGDCHTKGCVCNPCLKQLQNPSLRRPLTQILFKDEASWRQSLPEDGIVTVTGPRMSNYRLKKLSSEPLKSKWEPLKLKELEERFPGGRFVLATRNGNIEVESYAWEHYVPGPKKKFWIYIANKTEGGVYSLFSELGSENKHKLMVVYQGKSFDLSHLL